VIPQASGKVAGRSGADAATVVVRIPDQPVPDGAG
jgi:hypothetical protein